MLHKHIAGRAPVPGGLLLPCDLDEVQGGQARPPLVPKHFSRLLPHKARTGPLSGGGSTTLRTGPRAEGDNGPRPRGTSQPPPVRGPGTEVSRGGTPSLTPRGSRPGRLQADTCQQGVRLSSRLVNRSHGNAPPKKFPDCSVPLYWLQSRRLSRRNTYTRKIRRRPGKRVGDTPSRRDGSHTSRKCPPSLEASPELSPWKSPTRAVLLHLPTNFLPSQLPRRLADPAPRNRARTGRPDFSERAPPAPPRRKAWPAAPKSAF